MRLSQYLPNWSDKLTLTRLDAVRSPHRPVRLIQIVGGRSWSLSLVINRTKNPVFPTPPRRRGHEHPDHP